MIKYFIYCRKSTEVLDVHLEGVLEIEEYHEKKVEIEQGLKDFERKGNHWLELTRDWILEVNQAKNLALQEDFSEMKKLLKKTGSNRQIAHQRLSIDFKKPWSYLANLPASARRGEVTTSSNSIWWR